MAWIRTVPPEEADGPLAKQYEAAVARAGRVYQIVQSMSIAPGILDASMKHFGQIAYAREGLTRSNRELVAVVVSVVNECHY